jgi:hypothetical protein
MDLTSPAIRNRQGAKRHVELTFRLKSRFWLHFAA